MLSTDQFEELVGLALDDLPPFFADQLKNVVVLLERWPSRETLRRAGVAPGHTLLGLYHGIPLTERTQGYNLVAPDTITLFQGPIENAAGRATGEELLALIAGEIRHTVIHEIAHHFGISDERLHELGAY